MTYRPGPRDLRASDSDRERVIELLGQAVADGRLTAAEHADRVERAYQARTLGDLAGLTADLAAPADQPIRLDSRRAVTGVFGRDGRDGHWVVPASFPVLAVFGEVELDLRDALLESSRTVIYATVVAGTLHLILPEGVTVETSGTTLLTRQITRGSRAAGRLAAGRGRPQDPGPAAPQPGVPPVIEVRMVAFGGTIRLTAPKKPRRLGGLHRHG